MLPLPTRVAFLGYADGKLRVYDLTRQERAPPMRSSDALRVFTSHAGGANCLAVSPDGRHVMSGGDDAVCKVMA
jgi:WD40 repeat protein